MNALLALIERTEDVKALLSITRAKNISIVHAVHNDVALTEKIINDGGFVKDFGSYSSRSDLSIGPRFEKNWKIVKAEESDGKTFTDLIVFLSPEDAPQDSAQSISELQEALVEAGAKLTDTPDTADIIVSFNPKLPLWKNKKNALIVNYLQIKNALPHKTKRFKGDAASLWKLLNIRDFTSIHQGLELATSLPDQIDTLIDGCEIDESGQLVRSKRFTGTGPAQTFSDVALLGLLSAAPSKSKAGGLRAAIRKIDISVAEVPILKDFDSLETLSLHFAQNPNLSRRDLSNLQILPNLINLQLTTAFWSNKIIESLDGLDAPKLETISACNIGLKDISALKKLKNLKVVYLSNNQDLISIDGLIGSALSLQILQLNDCEKLQSIDALLGTKALNYLNLNNCKAIYSIKPLIQCQELETLILDGSMLPSLEGLDNISIKNSKVSYEFQTKSEIKLRDLINLQPQTKDLKFGISKFTIRKN